MDVNIGMICDEIFHCHVFWKLILPNKILHEHEVTLISKVDLEMFLKIKRPSKNKDCEHMAIFSDSLLKLVMLMTGYKLFNVFMGQK